MEPGIRFLSASPGVTPEAQNLAINRTFQGSDPGRNLAGYFRQFDTIEIETQKARLPSQSGLFSSEISLCIKSFEMNRLQHTLLE